MSNEPVYKITVTQNGPYIVSGGVPLSLQVIGVNAEGGSWEWEAGPTLATKEIVALCRCGGTDTAPFCNGAHVSMGFDGTETASRLPFDRQKVILAGPALTLEDARPFCAAARFCDAVKSAWDLPAQSNEPEARDLLIHQVTHCPSGRLVARDTTSSEVIEPVFEPSIGIVEDPAENCGGPLWVRGGIALESQDGQAYEARNRMTLCRCGQSKNKPFCGGTHLEIRYNDGINRENPS